MEIPLIPDLSNPKWLIVQEMLKSIGSAHAKKVASRLKIPVDINTWRKRFEIGKGKKYRWSYSSSDGYYLGYKLILTIDAITFDVLGFEI